MTEGSANSVEAMAAAGSPIPAERAGGGRSRNPAIDLLRASCILWIVGFWHLLGYADAIDGYKNDLTYRLTVVVLGLFVFISGHLIGGASITSLDDVMRFYRRRLIRIYPPYLLALLLFDLCRMLQAGQFWRSAFLVSSFSLNPPPTLWYISMIVVFYLVAPWLLLLYHQIRAPLKRFPADRLIFSGLVVVLTAVLGRLVEGVDPRLFLYFPAFVVGLMLSPALSSPLRSNRSLLLVVGVLPIAVAYSFGNLAPVEESLSSIPLVIFGPLFLFLLANRWLEGVRLPEVVRLVSTASYFMYLFHRPIFRLFTSGSFPDTALGQLAVLLLICLPVTVLLSWQGQLLYDRWVRQLDRPAPSPAG